LDHLQGRGYEVVERGYALLGYAVAGPAAGLLLATRVREKAVLPGGHTVYAVTDSQWAVVPLQVRWVRATPSVLRVEAWCRCCPVCNCCRQASVLPNKGTSCQQSHQLATAFAAAQ